MQRSTPEKLVKQLSAVRKKKLERIKSKIQSGKYKINNWDLAKALFLSQ